MHGAHRATFVIKIKLIGYTDNILTSRFINLNTLRRRIYKRNILL